MSQQEQQRPQRTIKPDPDVAMRGKTWCPEYRVPWPAWPPGPPGALSSLPHVRCGSQVPGPHTLPALSCIARPDARTTDAYHMEERVLLIRLLNPPRNEGNLLLIEFFTFLEILGDSREVFPSPEWCQG